MPSLVLRWVAELALGLVVVTGARTAALVFESSRGGLSELWRSTEAGSPPARLLPSGLAAFDPAVAPDGRVAFMRPGEDGRQALWLVRADGSGLRRLSPGGVEDRMPAFAPDGQRLAFVRQVGAGGSEIRVMQPNGLRTVAIRTAGPGVQHLSPAWDLEGRRIAFASNAGGRFRIWLMASDGSGARPVTEEGAGDLEPTWSPDGRRLAFVRQFADGESDLVIRDLATGTERRITLAGTERRPIWGPLGERIAFASDADGDFEIYTLGPDGTGLRQLTDNTVADLAPAWLPGRGSR